MIIGSPSDDIIEAVYLSYRAIGVVKTGRVIRLLQMANRGHSTRLCHLGLYTDVLLLPGEYRRMTALPPLVDDISNGERYEYWMKNSTWLDLYKAFRLERRKRVARASR